MLEAYERKANTSLDLAAPPQGEELQKPPRIKRLHTQGPRETITCLCFQTTFRHA